MRPSDQVNDSERVMCFHPFARVVEETELPRLFTYPFHYTPHPLCVRAAGEVQAYIASRADWREEVSRGKMFGVLVVRKPTGETGFLAAFSGILAGTNVHDYFVPPVYDLLQPDGFFKTEERQISDINRRIEALQQSEACQAAVRAVEEAGCQSQAELAVARLRLKAAKAERDRIRAEQPDEARLAELVRESQYQKAEYRRLEKSWQMKQDGLAKTLSAFQERIERWKEERKTRSAALQRRLFEQYSVLNARGEAKDLYTLFAELRGELPPAGTGECAAPKLLQYAYLRGWTPLAMAEFWWGASPKSEVRHHGFYYPSCKSKCEPVLAHMLQGLEVEPDPLTRQAVTSGVPSVVYEDAWLLVVNKPAGLLSVPGKEDLPSVAAWASGHCKQAGRPLVVHRLDMATSGLLLLAKTPEVHRELQAQFESRAVKKRYMALLEGEVVADKGFIRLPMCPDVTDRPRQMVSEQHGKPAVTRYEVLHRGDGHTRIAFYPLTGRTHQLRVHAAHARGLATPIVGDMLYGRAADRLYLHADRLEFRHPVTGGILRVEASAPF